MSNSVNSIEFYKEMHEKELRRKTEIDTSINFPTTLLTILIGGFLFLFKKDNFNYSISDNEHLIFVIIFLTLLFTISTITATVFLIRMYLNKFKKYKYLPLSSDLKNWEDQLIEHYKVHFENIESKKPFKKALKYSRDEFNDKLLNYYITFSTSNQLMNDERLEDNYKSRKYLIFSLILLAIIGIIILIK